MNSSGLRDIVLDLQLPSKRRCTVQPAEDVFDVHDTLRRSETPQDTRGTGAREVERTGDRQESALGVCLVVTSVTVARVCVYEICQLCKCFDNKVK